MLGALGQSYNMDKDIVNMGKEDFLNVSNLSNNQKHGMIKCLLWIIISHTFQHYYIIPTKEYTDNRASNVFIENNNISIMQTDIISADTAQL